MATLAPSFSIGSSFLHEEDNQQSRMFLILDQIGLLTKKLFALERQKIPYTFNGEKGYGHSHASILYGSPPFLQVTDTTFCFWVICLHFIGSCSILSLWDYLKP